MEYKDPGRYIPIIYLLYSWVPYLGFPVESFYYIHAKRIIFLPRVMWAKKPSTLHLGACI